MGVAVYGRTIAPQRGEAHRVRFHVEEAGLHDLVVSLCHDPRWVRRSNQDCRGAKAELFVT